MELSHQKRTRIERVLVRRRARHVNQQEPTAVQKHDGILVLMALGFSTLILGTIFLIHAEWSPGEQERIFQAYKATQHDAETVVVAEFAEVETRTAEVAPGQFRIRFEQEANKAFPSTGRKD